LRFEIRCGEAVVLAGIYCNADFRECDVVEINLMATSCSGRDDLLDLDAKRLCEFKVTLIMRRHGHDGSGAVADENIIRDPHGNFFAVHRIDGITTREDASLAFCQVGSIEITLE
jgi:hypothetical protein